MKKLSPVAASVILIILGILLIAWPDASVNTFVKLTAFGLLAVAIVGIAMHAMNKEEKHESAENHPVRAVRRPGYLDFGESHPV